MPEAETRAMAAARRLTSTTEQILAEVQQLPAEVIHRVPADGVWTVMDNLCHLQEFVPFWTGETLRIVQRAGEPEGRDHADTARLAGGPHGQAAPHQVHRWVVVTGAARMALVRGPVGNPTGGLYQRARSRSTGSQPCRMMR